MEYLRIYPDDTIRWNSVWELYEASFPLAERRKKEDHIRACTDERFFPMSAWDGQELIGLIFFWEWDSCRYLEYLAVNPKLRGQNFGSEMLRYLRSFGHTTILEIDPLSTELAVRRLRFYERSGYTLTPYRFVHLPYRLDSETQELLILSHPGILTKKQYLDFLRFMNEEVIRYCEQAKSKKHE